MAEQAKRADLILDAAGQLLLRFGYRKVTIEDVTRRAGVGKGTVYLHWRTKQELFEALLQRESIKLAEEIVVRVGEDPDEVRPHRISRTTFVLCHREPLMMAIMTGDADVLGELKVSPPVGQALVLSEEFLDIMMRHGLVRADVPDLLYAWQATTNGFYLLDTFGPGFADITVEAKADALAHALRAAFEPTGEPSKRTLAEAATELTTALGKIVSNYRAWTPHDENTVTE